LLAARQQARQGFEKNRSLLPAGDDFAKELKHAEEVAKILRQNVVQGQSEGHGDHYSMSLSLGSTELEMTVMVGLRIHEDIERGDNDTIKFEGQSMKARRQA